MNFHDCLYVVLFVFTVRCYAEHGIALAKMAVCLVTLRYYAHMVLVSIDNNYSIVRLGSSLSASPNVISLVLGERP